MTLEELKKEEHEEREATEEKKEEEKESKEESSSEETNKSFDQAILETLTTLTDHVKALSESQADLEERVHKALEEKPETQLELQPATSDSEDIGAEVTVPDTMQSNSIQAGLDDDKSGEEKPESDDKGLSMQEKAEKVNFDFTTETPRPSAAIENVNKSDSTSELNMILKDAREGGYDGLSNVAKKIMKGDYYTPSEEERWF
tara:strand:- start:12971 stop:13579 length:609 start_codon:yes stop_codon:yes gene_type:complete